MNETETKGSRAGFVAIIGRPSAGKSTLINTMCGEKVSIISAVPQTTRNRVRGIVTRPGGQLVLVDTPGFHVSDRTMNQHMRGLIDETVRESDAILYVVDGSRPPGEEERELVSLVAGRASAMPVVVALNKIDTARKTTRSAAEALLDQSLAGCPRAAISALTGEGVEELVSVLLGLLPEDVPSYPEDYYTDQEPEFRVSEIIREKAINLMRQELPHSLYVEVADMEVRNDEDTDRLWIRAFILVERNSQQGMVVGKGGEKIKQIRQSAQKEIARLFPYRIHLDLRVKVASRWQRDERVLRRLIR